MSDTEKISIAALISVILRRKLGRTIDVQWLIKDEAYASTIIKLSREQELDDLTAYADKLDLLIFGENKSVTKPIMTENVHKLSDVRKLMDEEIEEELDESKIDVSKYIGHLR